MDKIIYWMWLQSCINDSGQKIAEITKMFVDAENVFRASETEIKLSGLFSRTEAAKIFRHDTDKAEKDLEKCRSENIDIICYPDESYPQSLRDIEMPPTVLYVKGQLPSGSKGLAGIVGTRTSSAVGRQTSFDFSYNLAKKGYIIVSGGAEGIDSHAHHGALQSGGSTICVLGCGIGYPYLRKYEAMRNEIVKHGALVSEYPPGTAPTKFTFPKRNRIISGLADCIIVIEAGLGSGSLITASEAVKQNRTVFAVPGSIDDVRFAGSNFLLTAGALAAVSYNDITKWFDDKNKDQKKSDRITDNKKIEKIRKSEKTKTSEKKDEYLPDDIKDNKKPDIIKKTRTNKLLNINEKTKEKTKKEEKTDNFSTDLLTENAVAVYHTISDTPIFPDEICGKLGMDIGDVFASLTELEINGLIKSVSFNRYVRI